MLFAFPDLGQNIRLLLRHIIRVIPTELLAFWTEYHILSYQKQ